MRAAHAVALIAAPAAAGGAGDAWPVVHTTLGPVRGRN
eukprot:gene42632-22324_t